MSGVRLGSAPPGCPFGLPPRDVANEHATESRPELRADVKVFHKTQLGRFGAPFLHFAIDRFVHPVGEHGVDDGGENDVHEHWHGGLPEHGSPASA